MPHKRLMSKYYMNKRYVTNCFSNYHAEIWKDLHLQTDGLTLIKEKILRIQFYINTKSQTLYARGAKLLIIYAASSYAWLCMWLCLWELSKWMAYLIPKVWI